MQRRVFIQLSAYTAAALTLPISGCGRKKNDIESQPLVFSHLVDAKQIEETGMAYLNAHQGERGKNVLKNLLLADTKLSGTADDRTISTMLNSKVDEDFKIGRIIIVNGWVLSVTEARQCALFSILQS